MLLTFKYDIKETLNIVKSLSHKLFSFGFSLFGGPNEASCDYYKYNVWLKHGTAIQADEGYLYLITWLQVQKPILISIK